MKDSKIEWCDNTFNPWWGCEKVSQGCKNCYAETMANRWGHDIWGSPATTIRRTFGDKHWSEPLKWNAEAEKSGQKKRVFCGSMCDVFENHPQLQKEREKLFKLIEDTPNLIWLLLTKRPKNILNMIPALWSNDGYPSNIWFGTSAENNETLQERSFYLCQLKTQHPTVLFLSCEPLLEKITFKMLLNGIDWIIVGGESGHHKRPFDCDWARSIRDECIEWTKNGGKPKAFFMKQVDKIQPIPADLMIRQFPS